MPAYHFTYHAYRSWNTDREEGWHQHGEPGTLLPQPHLAEHRNRISSQAEMEFTPDRQQALLEILQEIITKRQIRLHGCGIDASHVHTAVSWKDDRDPKHIEDRLKNLMSTLLNKQEKRIGRRVFSKGGGNTRIHGHRHLNHLLNEYFPKHTLFYRER